MRKIPELLSGLSLLVVAITSGLPTTVSAEEKSIVQEQQAEGLLKGSIYSAWQRLRAMSPKSKENYQERNRMTATAGIRGAEQTDTVLKPYWKDDRTQDAAFLAQVETYSKAQEMIDTGKFVEAIAALDGFIKDYPGSALMPNALFAKGLASGAGNDIAAASGAFKKFIADYPGHPLQEDAKQVMASLQK
jgi:TolA-binding protein